uniref:Uncharacterized protein n=1 Tax=Anguilla anguilla TaxID=7936 RepID=A0A0E9XHK8_ANGAN
MYSPSVITLWPLCEWCFHMTVGSGLPMARHMRVTLLPSFTVMSADTLEILAGTCTMRWTLEDLGFLLVRMEHTYGPSSCTSTFWIFMLYSVTAVLSSRTTRGSKVHLSLPANSMVVRFSQATRETLLSVMHFKTALSPCLTVTLSMGFEKDDSPLRAGTPGNMSRANTHDKMRKQTGLYILQDVQLRILFLLDISPYFFSNRDIMLSYFFLSFI